MTDATPESQRPGPSEGPGRFRLLAWFLLGLAAAPWALSLLARWWWFADLATHFRFQCLVGTGFLGVALLLARRWRPLAACGVLALLYGWPMLGGLVAPFEKQKVAGLRVMTANVLVSNRDPAPLLAHAAAVDPDVLCLQEVDARWAADLAPLHDLYPHRRVLPRPDPFGLAVFSKHPATFRAEDVEGLPILRATVRHEKGGDTLTVFNVHVSTPLRRGWADRRNRALRTIAAKAAAVGGPVLVCGDLNCSPWSPHFADLLVAGDLRDPRRGGWSPPSWRAANPLLALPIDHLLHGGGTDVWDLRAGPDIGSDHRPLTVRVRW